MSGSQWLAGRFEANRKHLRAVAYRMLGSLAEADDAVQECWLRVSRADTGGVDNLEGWLTIVLARVCLNMLRSRRLRREEPLDVRAAEPLAAHGSGIDPEHEALMAESVGLALIVVLERLSPAERVAFVLHDVFDVPFETIAPVVRRTPVAARQLASRARRRVRGTAAVSDADLVQQRTVVDAFLAALRAGDLDRLIAVLDPDVVRRADRVASPAEAARELRGAASVAEGTLAYLGLARFARPALVDGTVGIIVAPRGRLRLVVHCAIRGGKIAAMDVIAEAARLQTLELAVLHD